MAYSKSRTISAAPHLFLNSFSSADVTCAMLGRTWQMTEEQIKNTNNPKTRLNSLEPIFVPYFFFTINKRFH